MFIAIYIYTDADSSQAIQPEKTALKQSVCASNVSALSTQLYSDTINVQETAYNYYISYKHWLI